MSASTTPVIARRFGANLRRARHGAGLSQEQVSQRAKLHRTEIGLLERGERTPRIDTVAKLAAAIGIPPAALLDGIVWMLDPDSGKRAGRS